MSLNTFDRQMLEASDVGTLLSLASTSIRNWLLLEPDNLVALGCKKQYDDLVAAREARKNA